MIFTSCTKPKKDLHNPEVVKVVSPTCVSVGYTEYSCKHCGNGTWIDDVTFAKGHVFGDGVAIVKEDCTTLGIYESKCLSCDEINRYTISAKGHSYVEVSQDGETVAYECEVCGDVVNIASDERIEDYISATELFDVETSFTFNVISEKGADYIKENLKILDAYFYGSEYENDSGVLVGYELKSNGNNSYTVIATVNYEHDNTYIAKLSGDVTFEEYRGRELFFTVIDNPDHENEVEYGADVVFLSALQAASGGYYPYQVNSSEDGGSLYLVVNKIDGISKGQILCIGEVGSLEEISYDTECYFGIVDGFYPLDDGKWMVTLAEPELQKIFDKFDIAFNDEIDLSNVEIDEDFEKQIAESLYSNEDFVEFLSAVKVSSEKYFEANGYYSPNLLDTETFLNGVQVNPTVNFDGKKLKTEVKGIVTLDVNNGSGANVGTLKIDFDFNIETQLKVDVNYDINTKWKGITLEKFDVAITQTDIIGFDFRVSVNSNEIAHSGYVINKNTGEAHLACCVEVTRASNSSIFEKATFEQVNAASKKCEHCKPEDGASFEKDFNGYYMDTLYCSDWEKVAQDIQKLTKVDSKGAKVNVKMGKVEIPLCGPVAIKIDLGFALTFDARAILDYSYAYTQTSTYGMRLNHGYMQPYSQMSNGSVTQTNVAVLGSAEARVGLRVDTYITISGFEKWINAGVGAEVGAYAELNGVLDTDKNYHGAYFEVGAYLDIDAYYKLIKKDGSSDLAEIKRALQKYGYEKLYFAYEKYEEKLNILGSYDIAGNDLLKVKYFDLVNMSLGEGKLYLSQVTLSFADGSHCEIKDGKIVAKSGVTEKFTDTLIITVASDGEWGKYYKGSAIYYLGVYEIEFEFDPLASGSDNTASEGLVFSENYYGYGYSVIDYNGDETHIIIPSTYNGLPVTTIAGYAFDYCTSIVSVDIPDTVTTICEGAFMGCTSLKTVSLGNSVTTLHMAVFMDCTSLVSIEIPDSVTTIGDRTFEYCTSLESVKLSNSMTAIAGSTFSNCYALKSIVIPNSVVFIADLAFNECTSLASVVIGDSVISIGSCAFYSCTSLQNVVIPDSVESIGDYAFWWCESLTSIEIPDLVTSIGHCVFYSCISLQNIVIPNSVESIGDYAFHCCTSLNNVVIPNSVTSIGEGAFSCCGSITSVVIPDSVRKIGAYAFTDCSLLTIIYCEAESPTILWSDDWNYTNIPVVWGYKESVSEGLEFSINEDGVSYSVTGIGSCTDTDIIIPSEYNGLPVTSIGDGAFGDCSSLTSVTIPDSVTSIGNAAFYYCTSLTSITIPDSVTSIGDWAFEFCSLLTSATIGNSVTSIGEYAFHYCTLLTSITLPDSVESIGEGAFLRCSSLTSITFEGNIPSYSYGNIPNLTTIVLQDGVTSIGEWAFLDCSSLTSVTISDSVTSIGEYAFGNCSSLTSITIPESVTSIGNVAFDGCSSLISITIPDSVTSIGAYAFDDCRSLISITIPASVTSIGVFAFDDCTSLTIYCEAESQPSGWDSSWNPDNRPVVWGYKEQ